MNLSMGSQVFENVEVPVLWGDRAIIEDSHGRLSVIALAGQSAQLEIVGNEPAPGVHFRPTTIGIVIIGSDRDLYSFDAANRTLSSISFGLPDIRFEPGALMIGTNRFSGNRISGFGVGIVVRTDGIAIGAPLPAGLAKLRF
jgi:hypothetical protein